MSAAPSSSASPDLPYDLLDIRDEIIYKKKLKLRKLQLIADCGPQNALDPSPTSTKTNLKYFEGTTRPANMRSIINAAVCLLLPALHRAWTLSPRTLALPRQRALAMMATKEFVIGQGCFWGPQQAYDKLPVLETKVGYSGGNNTTPSYRTVCAGDGHTEAVKVVYDDATVSFDTLLNVFFDRDISEFDNGPGQYENVIFVSNDAERNAVERRRQQMATTNDPRRCPANKARTAPM